MNNENILFITLDSIKDSIFISKKNLTFYSNKNKKNF